MPGFQTDRAGMDEARLDALKACLVAKVADLDTVLALSPLSWVYPSGVTGTNLIMIGDTDAMADESTTPFLICLTGGGKRDGLDWEVEWKRLSGPNISPATFGHTIHSTITVYIHPRVLPVAAETWTNIKTQTEYRERLRARICDWIRGDVFQTGSPPAAVDLTLTSKETTTAGDNMTKGTIVSIYKDLMPKQFGNEWLVYGISFHIQHEINT